MLSNPDFLPLVVSGAGVQESYWIASEGFQCCTGVPSMEQLCRESAFSADDVLLCSVSLCIRVLSSFLQTPFKFPDKDGMADVTSRTVVVRETARRERGGRGGGGGVLVATFKGRPNSRAFFVPRRFRVLCAAAQEWYACTLYHKVSHHLGDVILAFSLNFHRALIFCGGCRMAFRCVILCRLLVGY